MKLLINKDFVRSYLATNTIANKLTKIDYSKLTIEGLFKPVPSIDKLVDNIRSSVSIVENLKKDK